MPVGARVLIVEVILFSFPCKMGSKLSLI